MPGKSSLSVAAAFILLTFAGCSTTKIAVTGDPSGRTAGAEREFRAAWVATVANINWPSKPGLSVGEQKSEAIALLDLLYKNNFNAVVFQVRPHCDAMYRSDIEPWSYYLTGEEGKAPDPYYDPLEFWIAEAHARGIELHAWLNPYRAHHPAAGPVTDGSIVKKRPDLVLKLDVENYWWMDPALKGTQDHSYSVVMDLVRRYDLDGIHFDDYFYPYPDYNNFKDFPDDESWKTYQAGGGKLSRSDWRREAVNVFIERLYKGIKAEKPWVKFGLSPFGIWQPFNPPAIGGGFNQHETLYADAKLWLNNGWIDYYSPQLYWPVNQIAQSYPVLLGWWKEQNLKGRHLWPGINIGLQPAERAADETINQIMITRGLLPESPGVVHWSIGPLVRTPGLINAVAEGPYRRKALVPPSPWLDEKAPAPPVMTTTADKDELRVSWSHPDPSDVGRWVVYYKYGPQWNQNIHGNAVTADTIPAFTVNRAFLGRTQREKITGIEQVLIPLDSIAMSAVDRFGNESALTKIAVREFTFADAPPLVEVLTAYYDGRKRPPLPVPAVTPGINVLVDDHLDLIKGKRVGLITNPSAVGTDMRSTVDILASTEGVNLVALFGAEHGIRGALHGRIQGSGEPD
ncbi:MAG: family 10 glycosylhydrolase, partial [Bacteroidales bacterium]|nr:family 10 glycosylhydrolase [Bacteroidales bacterium]